jgi:hypothetical protein
MTKKQVAEGQDSRLDVAHPDKEDGGRSCRGSQADQEGKTPFDEGDADARPHALARAANEALSFAGFPPERLDYADGG